MLTLDSAEQDALDARDAIVARTLIWITAKNRSTGEAEALGLWSGRGVRVFSIAGSDRSYIGPAVGILPPITAGVGLAVRELRLPVPPLHESVQEALLAYDARLAPVEIHQALYDPASRALLAEPRRVFKGWIDRTPFNLPAAGGEGAAELVLVSAARGLTRTCALYQADADQQDRAPGDLFRRYSAGAVLREVRWGTRDVKVAKASSPAPSYSTDGDR